ncbi:MAG: VCBS repeat-containing protein [Pseudomonadota bacterium]|nr:VCBS repeat-containing protein [Pseudomonadota bacterium]
MRAPLLLLATLPLGGTIGCTMDFELNEWHEGPNDIQNGLDTPPPDVDTDFIPAPDTGPVVPPPECRDRSFEGGTILKLDECDEGGTVIGTFTPEVLWSQQAFTNLPGSASVMMQPVVCSLTDDDGDGDQDADDTPDIVFVTYSPGVLRAVSGDDGHELWGVPGVGTLQITGGAACGDIDGDGSVEILAATAGGVEAFDRNGTSLWSTTACSDFIDGISDAPGIADMNHDGRAEVIVGSCILDADGNVLGQGEHGWGSSLNVGSSGFAVDLDLDGELEVVTGNAAYSIDGTTLWFNGERDGYVGIGNFDEDAFGEIAVTGNAVLRVQDDDGTVLCTAAIPSASSSYGGPPTVADFDADGEAEIGVAANSTYVVFERDCTVLWQVTDTTDPSSGNTGASVFDFEGDGVADVVYADERWVWVFDGRDGSVKMQDDNHTNNTWFEYPTIADVNADGSADIVVANTPGRWGSLQGITVFSDDDRSWQPGRRIWNQHAYSITNVDDDGGIPIFQDPNWLTYNNFRSGDLTPGVSRAWPDLYVQIEDVCTDACAWGNVTVWFTVGNQGYANVTSDVLVDVWGEAEAGMVYLGGMTWTADMPAGISSSSESLELTGVPTQLTGIVVTIDGGDATSFGVVDECYEGNNVDEWNESVCP